MIVEVRRGGLVESRHEVDAVVVSLDGPDGSVDVVEAHGDADRLVMPRSAIKPIQAVPLVRSGAFDAFDLEQADLALACASHNGEAAHVERVAGWLERLGLSAANLECGPEWPIFQPASDVLKAAGIDRGPQHNNCSGKHSGFLTVCTHLGLDPEGYINPDHRLQRDHVTAAIEEFCRFNLTDQTPVVDGCGIPVWSIPLSSLAAGWSRLAASVEGSRIVGAMMAEPFFVAGTGRGCTQFMSDALKPLAVKVGAEGVYCGVVAVSDNDDSARYLGIALKVRDGARRAAEVAMASILERYGALPRREWPLHNHAGRLVGELTASGFD